MDTTTLKQFIELLNVERDSSITFDEFKEELSKHKLSFKEDENLAIVYSDEFVGKNSTELSPLEKNTRSVVLEKDSMKILCSQYNGILYNDEMIEHLKLANWNEVTIEQCYEGTTLLVFNHNDNWYVSTRRCLDASKSFWNHSISYREMFDEAIKDKFTLDSLDKTCTYTFVLVHYLNKNIVNYNSFGDEYCEVIHTQTKRNFTNEEVTKTIENVKTSTKKEFESLEKLMKNLNELDATYRKNKKICSEGYIVKYKNYIGKLQPLIYQEISEMKPNNSNINQVYLELYQTNKLDQFLPYFTFYVKSIKQRIHNSMKTITQEFLDIYHATRNQKNKELYDTLPEVYKKVLFGIHGIYIENRKVDFNEGVELAPINQKSHSISLHDIYHYLKGVEPHLLRSIFFERNRTITQGTANKFIRQTCIYCKTHTNAMSLYIN
ncbi:MAG: hypothetical protein CMF62_02180 [Magnetococcales bacterium]|nr:hypothetical protein [Magnetococcales bacterium]|tara:strand:+ start:6722 stop:8029 length:1308 start_codon:yes stop_codon:yes gene_type:complete